MVYGYWFMRYKDLTGQTLCRLQENLNTTDYILYGEYAMLGQVTFGWIDKRCKLATGFLRKFLEGLPPVVIQNHQAILVSRVIKHIKCLKKSLNLLLTSEHKV